MTDPEWRTFTCRTREEATAKFAAALQLGLDVRVTKLKERSGGWLVAVLFG